MLPTLFKKTTTPRDLRHSAYSFLASIGATRMGIGEENRIKVHEILENYSRVKNEIYLKQINDLNPQKRKKLCKNSLRDGYARRQNDASCPGR